MKKINAPEIIDLIFLELTDIKVIEMIDKLGLEQPVLDDKYEIEETISVYNNEIGFTFKEIDGYSISGLPCIVGISFTNSENIILPYNLDFKDDYLTCVKKIEKEADYINDWDDNVKIWIRPNITPTLALAINYNDDNFDSIESIVFFYFNDSAIGDIYFPNKK